MENLSDILGRFINSAEGKIAVLVKDVSKDKIIYEYDSEKQLVSASVIKLPILLAALENVRKCLTSLSDEIFVSENDILAGGEFFENGEMYCTLEELLFWMIIKSDNTATNVIIKHIGMDEINQYITDVLGLRSTCLQRYMLDQQAVEKGLNNYTSQSDQLKIYEMLYKGEILDPELCDKAKEILSAQRNQNQIMRHIPYPVKFAHKTGTLAFTHHDAGIMEISGKLFFVGISLYDCKYREGNKPLTGNMGRAIYDYIIKNELD